MASINPMGRMTAHRNHTVANEITTESTGSRFTHTMTVDIRTQASVAAKAVTRVSCQGNHHHREYDTARPRGSRFTHTMAVDIRTQASVAAKAVTRVSCQGSHHHQSTTLPGQEVHASHIPWRTYTGHRPDAPDPLAGQPCQGQLASQPYRGRLASRPYQSQLASQPATGKASRTPSILEGQPYPRGLRLGV